MYEAFLMEEGESSARRAQIVLVRFSAADELREVFDAKAEIFSEQFEAFSFGAG